MLDYFCNFFKGKKPRGDVSQKISASRRKLLARELSSYDAVVITGGSSGIGRGFIEVLRSTSKIVEWEKKKRAKRIKNVLQCPMC